MSPIVGAHWTYSGNPAASDKDAVRHLLGDTDENDQQLSDEEIEWELEQAGSVVKAAVNAARSLAFRYGRQPESKTVGDFTISYGDLTKKYGDLAARLDTDVALRAMPYAGGISLADKIDTEEDTDRVQPSFYRGMMDHPEASWPDATDSERRTGYE